MDKEDVIHICLIDKQIDRQTDRQINMGYYSAITKNELLSFATTSMNLEVIMPGKISQT